MVAMEDATNMDGVLEDLRGKLNKKEPKYR